MTTSAAGTTTITPLAPGPAERIVHFWTCTATNDDVVTIPDRVTYVHDAWAVANSAGHGSAATLSAEETTIEQATKLDEVLFQAGNDEYLTGFSVSDIDEEDSVTGTGTAASTITYYKVAPAPSQGAVSSGVSTGGMIMVYFECVASQNEAISLGNVGIDKVYGAISFTVSTNAFTATNSYVGTSTETQKLKFTSGISSDSDVRGIAWGITDDVSKAANVGTALTEATGVKIWKIFPGPAEVNMRAFENTEVSTNEGISVTGMTEVRFAIAHKIAVGVSTINAVTAPTGTATEENMVKITTANSDVAVRGIAIGDVGTAGWSS